jgi:hypothetical protein
VFTKEEVRLKATRAVKAQEAATRAHVPPTLLPSQYVTEHGHTVLYLAQTFSFIMPTILAVRSIMYPGSRGTGGNGQCTVSVFRGAPPLISFAPGDDELL